MLVQAPAGQCLLVMEGSLAAETLYSPPPPRALRMQVMPRPAGGPSLLRAFAFPAPIPGTLSPVLPSLPPSLYSGLCCLQPHLSPRVTLATCGQSPFQVPEGLSSKSLFLSHFLFF